MMPVKLEPAAPRSRVKHSTTEPLRSQEWTFPINSFVIFHSKTIWELNMTVLYPNLGCVIKELHCDLHSILSFRNKKTVI